MKKIKPKKVKDSISFSFTLKDILIVLMILSYILIFFVYKHDIEQYQYVIKNPQKLCYIYYSNLNENIKSVANEVNYNNGSLNSTMIHILDIRNEIKR